MVVAISRELGVPVRYVGVGEKAGDLLPFNPKDFVNSLFDKTAHSVFVWGVESSEQLFHATSFQRSENMEEALELARRGIALTSPNPSCGRSGGRRAAARLSATDSIPMGLKHAEILALEQAGDQARGATLYLNLEPCSHTGRTGSVCRMH